MMARRFRDGESKLCFLLFCCCFQEGNSSIEEAKLAIRDFIYRKTVLGRF